MTGFLLLSLVAAAVVAGYLLLSSSKSREGASSSKGLVRPRFKDFRHSGATFEESQENYTTALREYNRKTGREWDE